MMKAREIIFISLVDSRRLERAIGVRASSGMVGFTDTYAEIVTKYPSLATNEARQATLQTVMLHEIGSASRAARAHRKVVMSPR